MKCILLVVITVFIFKNHFKNHLHNPLQTKDPYLLPVSLLTAKCHTKFYWPETIFARFLLTITTLAVLNNTFMFYYCVHDCRIYEFPAVFLSDHLLLLILCVPFFSVGHRFLVAICSKLSSRRRILGHSLAAL